MDRTLEADALDLLLQQIEALESWVRTNLSREASAEPLQRQLALLEVVRSRSTPCETRWSRSSH